MGGPSRDLTPDKSVRHLFGAELRRLRLAAGFSQEGLGRQVGFSGDQIGLVEKAARRPGQQLAEACDRTLDSGGALVRLWPLVDRSWTETARASAPLPVVIAGTVGYLVLPDQPPTRKVSEIGAGQTADRPPTVDASIVRLADDGLAALWDRDGLSMALEDLMADLPRRRFLMLSGAALTGFAHRWLTEDPSHLTDALAGRRIGTGFADDMDRLVDARRRMDDVLGGGAIAAAVTADTRLVVDVVKNASYDAKIGRRLHGTLAELARLSGWVRHDVGDEGGAQRHWVVGLRAANDAGDPTLGANILRCMADQALAVGRGRDAATLLKSAQAKAGTRLSSSERSELSGMLARALAVSGDERASRSAIDDALESADQARTGDAPPFLYWWRPAYTHGNIGNAYLTLGDNRQAKTHLAGTADKLGGFPRDRALYLLPLAKAHLRAGDLDEGVRIADQAIDLSQTIVSDRLRDRVRDFTEEVGRADPKAALALTEHAST